MSLGGCLAPGLGEGTDLIEDSGIGVMREWNE